MRQAGQHVASREAFGTAAREQSKVPEIDGNLSFVVTVAAAAQPNGAHSAFAQWPLERIGADRVSR